MAGVNIVSGGYHAVSCAVTYLRGHINTIPIGSNGVALGIVSRVGGGYLFGPGQAAPNAVIFYKGGLLYAAYCGITCYNRVSAAINCQAGCRTVVSGTVSPYIHPYNI